MSRQIVIGDVHFGKYANSVTWLESQIDYFHKDIFYVINKEIENGLDYVIFLGDIFDIRYSTNTQIGIEIKKLFREILNKFPSIKIYCIAGNHDFYSPSEELKEYNSYDLIFGTEFVDYYKNRIRFIIDEPIMIGKSLFAPWYTTEDQDYFDELLDKNKPTVVYCHTDCLKFNELLIDTIRRNNITIFSGHIHTPNTQGRMHTLGAALPLDFNDVNQDRYIYVCENERIIYKHINHTTLQFKRYYNEQIFSLNEESFDNAKVELCISSKNINLPRYIEQLQQLKVQYGTTHKFAIREIDNDEEVFENNELKIVTNINNYIEENVPEHLHDKYELIKDRIKNNN